MKKLHEAREIFNDPIDDEFEDELDASISKFSDFMSKEYASGRYTGD